MKNLILIAMTALALTIFNGCQKENPEVDQLVDGPQPQEAVKQDVYVENGYLAFKNMKAVDSLIQILNKMTRAEKETWEKEMGFISARAGYDALFDEYENLSSSEAFLSFKEKNKGSLKFNEYEPDIVPLIIPLQRYILHMF